MLASDSSVVHLLPSSRAKSRKAVILKSCLLMVLFGCWAASVFAQAPCAFTTTAANVTETCGNVGIGTSSPATLLELNGTQPAQTIRTTDPNSWGQIYFYENSTPKGALQFIGSTFPYDVNRQNAFEMWNSALGPIIFYANRFTLGLYPAAPNAGNGGVLQMSIAAGSPGSSRLTFGTDGSGWKYSIAKNQAGTVSDFFTVQDNGNVGVGTTTPQYKLDVNGTIHATQVIGAVYQDVAEWVPAAKAMPAGTVVVLNLEKNNEVMPSARAYDTAVAGVVSTHPGVLLGVGDASKAQIATTGRVPVKVDATKEPIKVGDLLVTSDRSGFAMKSIPLDLGGVKIHRPGTLIGKALEPLPGGEGEILVLLSLQ